MKTLKFVLIFIVFICSTNLLSQFMSKKKFSIKVPRYSISFTGGFGYVFGSANGDANDFLANYNTQPGVVFRPENLGMRSGYGLEAKGKYALGKKKKLRLTGSLGYNLFYNTEDRGRNRTKWNIMNLGAGMEYSFSPKQKERLILGYEINYNLMFGAWQTDIRYPDNSVSNIYTKFKPASRIGVSALAGMEFRLNKKMDMTVAVKGVWVNLFPKMNFYADGYETYVNDSQDDNGIQFSNSKQVIYFQVVTGITLPISYK